MFFQERNYDIFMGEISRFVKSLMVTPHTTQPESFMTHELIKEQRIHRKKSNIQAKVSKEYVLLNLNWKKKLI